MSIGELNPPILATCAEATGRVYSHGAHVTSWLPSRHSEALFVSSASRFAPDAAIRGGVPVVFPWFGAGPSGDLAPAHGFARISEWTPASVEQHPERVVVTYQLSGSDRATSFPYTFAASLRVSFGSTLDMSLTVRNDDTSAFSFEEALHTYLRVSEVDQVSIEGLDGAEFIDKVSGERRRQVGQVRFDGETDRIYYSNAALVLDDPGLGRRVAVSKSASAQTVVWNPGVHKAASMSDLGAGEWTSFVCIEGANVLDHAVHLNPGEQHTMGYSLAIQEG